MFRAPQLYAFLAQCEKTTLKREVLECGAGGRPGSVPLFARFAVRGYAIHGIDISEERLQPSRDYCTEHAIDADLRIADLRDLPFPDASLPFIYSYNTIFHMTKADIARSMAEIKRVLLPGGCCFVNFASVEDHYFGAGERIGDGEFRQREGDEQVIHSYYGLDEADSLFAGLVIEHKERRVLLRRFGEHLLSAGYIDYIARVPGPGE